MAKQPPKAQANLEHAGLALGRCHCGRVPVFRGAVWARLTQLKSAMLYVIAISRHCRASFRYFSAMCGVAARLACSSHSSAFLRNSSALVGSREVPARHPVPALTVLTKIEPFVSSFD